jgi:hypothetical protein
MKSRIDEEQPQFSVKGQRNFQQRPKPIKDLPNFLENQDQQGDIPRLKKNSAGR